MAKDTLRLGQVIGLFGPGAMLDLPDYSVLVMGLQDWEYRGKNAVQPIEEPRLARLLERRLATETDGRFSPGKPLTFRTPPIDPGDPKMPAGPTIKVRLFPQWFSCEAVDGDPPNRRRIVRASDLEPKRLKQYQGEDGKKRQVSPLRFVCGCENGHLQDIDWRAILHTRQTEGAERVDRCRRTIWLEDSGTSADPRDTSVVCDCGARLSLEDLFQPGRLGACRGARPWISAQPDPAGCNAPKGLRLLTRSATNTYFPQVVRVISLPESSDALEAALDHVWSVVRVCTTAEQVAMARLFNPAVAANLGAFPDGEVLSRIEARRARESGTADGEADVENPRLAEYRVLASGRPLIGENRHLAKLHAETLERSVWDPEGDPLLSGIASLVAVHRLREVACLYGFTRFEPAPLAEDGIEDVGLAIAGAPLAENPEWLPAIEQFGEGFFLRFDPGKLAEWAGRDAVRLRQNVLRRGVRAWERARAERGAPPAPVREGDKVEFVMAHSLAHALMTEVSLDCGYPASALKERLYLLPGDTPDRKECGLLIYTASAGTEGTLGGLVEVTQRFPRLLRQALDRLELCSGDPVCADHAPESAAEDRMLHGAACHGCLLVSETSCEQRNVFLDRTLLVSTIAERGAGFFEKR